MKFCFRRGQTQDLQSIFEGLNLDTLFKYLESQKVGTRMHLVVRPRPGFDIEAKRNYFHGPMLDWIVGRLREMGIPAPREQMRDELIRRFVGLDNEGKTLSVAKTIEQKVKGDPRDPEKKYGDLITDVRIWCRDVLNGEPPYPDEVDLDEESESCATPETI